MLTQVQHNITTKSMEPWTNHVKGALALLDYRGQEQLGKPIGLQLIRSLRTQVVSISLQKFRGIGTYHL